VGGVVARPAAGSVVDVVDVVAVDPDVDVDVAVGFGRERALETGGAVVLRDFGLAARGGAPRGRTPAGRRAVGAEPENVDAPAGSDAAVTDTIATVWESDSFACAVGTTPQLAAPST
jgi:hypothetical protein